MDDLRTPISLDPTRMARTLVDVDDIGNRFHGTRGEGVCLEYLETMFDQIGLDKIHPEPFRYLAYEPAVATCELLNPGHDTFPCRPLQFSSTGTIEGQAVYAGAGTARDLEYVDSLGASLSGKVAITKTALPFAFAPIFSARDVSGVINVADTPDGLIPDYIAVGFPPPLSPPWTGRPVPYLGVTVEADAGQRLLSALTVGSPVTVRLHHEASYTEKEASNLVGDIQGETEEEVIIGAHYDSQAQGPGIWDNGTGLAGLLEIARVLVDTRPRRTIRVIAFASEEIGLWGAAAYTAAHETGMEQVAGMVNLDALSSRYPGKRAMWVDETMQAFAVDAAKAQGWEPEVIVDGRDLSFSDNTPFLAAGVPAAWAWENPPLNPYYHTDGDVLDLIDAEKLAETAGVSAQIVHRLAAASELDLRARVVSTDGGEDGQG